MNNIPPELKHLYAFVSRSNFIADQKIVCNHYLVEYDIRHANISMLKTAGSLSDEMYNYMESLPKMEREIIIGNWIRGEKYIRDGAVHLSHTEAAIKEGIKNAKYDFCRINNIETQDIVRIASDALIVKVSNTTHPYIQDINPYILFHISGIYTTMIKLADIILLFNSETCAVDIKGISDDKLFLHQPFLTAICELLLYIENGDKKVALMKHKELYENYISMALPLEYYRELNAGSGYKLKYQGTLQSVKTARLIALPDQFDIRNVDMSHNLYILRELYSIILEMN